MYSCLPVCFCHWDVQNCLMLFGSLLLPPNSINIRIQQGSRWITVRRGRYLFISSNKMVWRVFLHRPTQNSLSSNSSFLFQQRALWPYLEPSVFSFAQFWKRASLSYTFFSLTVSSEYIVKVETRCIKLGLSPILCDPEVLCSSLT